MYHIVHPIRLTGSSNRFASNSNLNSQSPFSELRDSYFSRSHQIHMLIQAVFPHGRALELIPDGYSDTQLRLDILGVFFNLVGNTKDLGQSIGHYILT